MERPVVDEEHVQRVVANLQRKKSREEVWPHLEQILEETRKQFGDVIVKVEETTPYDGEGDIAVRVSVRDRFKEVDEFIHDQTYDLLVGEGISIHVYTFPAVDDSRR